MEATQIQSESISWLQFIQVRQHHYSQPPRIFIPSLSHLLPQIQITLPIRHKTISRPLIILNLDRLSPCGFALGPQRLVVVFRELFLLEPFTILGPDFNEAECSRITGIFEEVEEKLFWLRSCCCPYLDESLVMCKEKDSVPGGEVSYGSVSFFPFFNPVGFDLHCYEEGKLLS